MVYRFIDENKEALGLRWLLRKLKVSSCAYYNYKKKRNTKRVEQKMKICKAISEIYDNHNGLIGYRTMTIFLARRGIHLSTPTVHKYMNKELKLYSAKSYKKTIRKKAEPTCIFRNILKQNFSAYAKNIVWCTDFTTITLSGGSRRFNCSVIDLYDRTVVASTNSSHMNSDLAITTIKKAIEQEKPPKGLILHSDRGSQFTSSEFINFCKDYGIIQSMSEAGCPYDNAPMERFYNTLKKELVYPGSFSSDSQFDKALGDYVFVWYNKIRPHSYNNGLTPYQTRYMIAN